MFRYICYQFSYHIELVVSREHQCFLLNDLFRSIRHQLLIFFNLKMDELLKDIHHAVFLEYIFPKISCRITARICRISFTTIVSGTIRTLIERKKVCIFTGKLCGHPYFQLIHAEISKDSLIKLEADLTWISVIHPLAFRIIHILSGVLVLQFKRKYRYTINSNNHIYRVTCVNRIIPLAITSNLIFLIKVLRCLIEARLRLEIADTKCNSSMLETMSQYVD